MMRAKYESKPGLRKHLLEPKKIHLMFIKITLPNIGRRSRVIACSIYFEHAQFPTFWSFNSLKTFDQFMHLNPDFAPPYDYLLPITIPDLFSSILSARIYNYEKSSSIYNTGGRGQKSERGVQFPFQRGGGVNFSFHGGINPPSTQKNFRLRHLLLF